MQKSPHQMFRNAAVARKHLIRAAQISEFKSVSLDAAVTMALQSLKEAVVHISIWSLHEDVYRYIPILDDASRLVSEVGYGYVVGLRTDYLIYKARELYENVRALGVITTRLSPTNSKRKDIGYLLWGFGDHMSDLCDIQPSAISFQNLDLVKAINSGITAIIADNEIANLAVAGIGTNGPPTEKLAYSFLMNDQSQTHSQNGGGNGTV